MNVSWYCRMPYDCLMRVITVNVCGIRSAAAKGLFRWLRRQGADFICLQETRSQEHQLVEHKVTLPGYQSFFCDAERKGYAGVALYTRHTPQRVVRGFGITEFDREGRYLEAQFGELSVVSLYLPSGSAGPERQAAKFRFLDAFAPHPGRLRRRRRHYILGGASRIMRRSSWTTLFERIARHRGSAAARGAREPQDARDPVPRGGFRLSQPDHRERAAGLAEGRRSHQHHDRRDVVRGAAVSV